LKWMNQTWNVNIVGIPYRGGGPIAQALVAGELQIAKMGLGNFVGLLGTGKIKPLAVAAARRSVLVPEIPTLAEAGIDFPPFGWWGLAAPRGVPRPIVDRLNTALSRGEIRRVSRKASRAAGARNACGIFAIPHARPPGRRVLDQNLQSIARGLQAAVMNETHAVAYLAWISDLRLGRGERRAAAAHPCAARRQAA
jgi:hypothetical protein